MTLSKSDLAIFNKFEFTAQPVGVKFLPKPPDNIEKLPEKLALCEMLKKAQTGNAFFTGAENHTCGAGTYVLGQEEIPEPFISGEYGAGLQLYEEARTGGRLYHHVPTIRKGVVNYVAFSPLDKLSFDPDVLIILANINQTEIILRASSYRTGNMWESKCTPAIGCGWIFVYPYLTGQLNYIVTGLGHGMKRRKLFPEGMQIISIPFDILPSMITALQEMPWVLPACKPDGLEFVSKLYARLGITS
ncbi:DUF169 domain-containing protein [Chloroflexota bacterium]